MIVSAIEPKKKGLCALYIDGEFVTKVDTETVLKMRVDVGQEIDDEKLFELISASDTKRAKDKALWLISYRDHSKRELIEKVSKYSSVEAATQAVERLEELGLINDENFARRYATDLLNLKKLSPSGAVRKLIEKGIDRELARDTVDSLECDVEENIHAIINKKYAHTLNEEKGKRRCINALMRLGYSYSDIKSAINQYASIEDYDY